MSFCGHDECVRDISLVAQSMLTAAQNDPDVLDRIIAETSFDLMRDLFKAGKKLDRAEWVKFMNYFWTIRDFAISHYVRAQKEKGRVGKSGEV